MKSSTKSSITLLPEEFRAVQRLRRRIRAKSNVAVVREALRVLEATTNREVLRESFRAASVASRAARGNEPDEFDALVGDGLDDAE